MDNISDQSTFLNGHFQNVNRAMWVLIVNLKMIEPWDHVKTEGLK